MEFGKRGVPGSALDVYLGYEKAGLNLVMDILSANPMLSSLPKVQFSIADEELGGAALFDLVTAAFGVASVERNAARVLPRSGPIHRSLGALSRAEQLARKLDLNINSATTRQVLNSLDDTVASFVGRFRRGSIHRELPREVLDMTVEEALKHSSKVRKLLIDSRFVK